jgi:bifunctional non-homologous end joining protein LigD
VNELRCRSCLIDGEVVCCDEDGIPVFQRLRYRRGDAWAFLYAFDLLKLDGKDLRREPFESRKTMLAKLLRNAGLGLRLGEHMEGEGATIFLHPCKLGLECIVSKRRSSRYQAGRTPH